MLTCCALPRVVHTVGHSTRDADVFLDLVRAHAIDCIVDVRRWPASRRYPHFARDANVFLGLVRAHAIDCIVDVRRWPASRRYPHFARAALAAALAEVGVDYVWRQDLGGYREPRANSPNTGWRTGAFRAYADFMLTPPFEAAVSEVERLAAAGRIALMCAEALPERCHRQLLADAFTVRGWPVRHILHDGCAEHHVPRFARPSGTRILYPGEACAGSKREPERL